MRAFAERVYGMPPEQVIGSSGKGPALLCIPNQSETEMVSPGVGGLFTTAAGHVAGAVLVRA
jgi:hypothetical protein